MHLQPIRPQAQPGAGYRLRRAGGLLVIIVAITVGGGGGALLFFAAAAVTTSVPAMSALALLGSFALTSGLTWAAFRALRSRRASRVAPMAGASTTCVLVAVAALTIFRPLAAPQRLPALPSGASYWELPTGSRIAVLHLPAKSAAKTPPLILVHGGPGAFEVTASGAAYYGALAAEGMDVYLYDQVGSGHSARLTDPWEYTVGRHVADLEALRQRIGAERVLLLGDSWGATLVANYMAVHGEHVARVIFTSPGAISRADWPESLTPASRISADEQRRYEALFEHPRFRLWQLLLRRDVQAAYRFIPEAELDGFADRIVGSFLDGALCAPHVQAREDLSAGFGFWSLTMTNWDMNERHFDPHAALRTNPTPALVLRGECDYIAPAVAASYQQTLPNATLVTVPRAGHLMYFEQPELYLALVQAFLLDQPLPQTSDTAVAIAHETGNEPCATESR